AARPPYGRLPQPTYAGTGLRTAARLLALLRPVAEPPGGMALQLMTSLVVLVESIAQLYRVQGRDAQEAAARRAGMHLGKAAPAARSWDGWLAQPEARPCPVDLALSAFPKPWARTHAGGGVGATVRPQSRRVTQPPDRGPAL
ncbi:hypothetical protein ACFQ07_25410, partial [Actinomadura adrarensis]